MAKNTTLFKSSQGQAAIMAHDEKLLKALPVAYEELELSTHFGSTHL